MTGFAQLAVMTVPLAEKVMPFGKPEIVTLNPFAVLSVILIEPLIGVPATPFIGETLMAGPATAMVTV